MNAVNITENMNIEEKAACNVKNIDIEDNEIKTVDEKNVNSCVEYIDIPKNSASNFEHVDIEKSLINKLENTNIEEIVTNSIENIDEKNHASNIENVNTDENIVKKTENVYSGENLDSIEEITSGESSDNVENFDSEDNFADIENSDTEEKTAHDIESILMKNTDVKGKIARFKMVFSGFKTFFEPLFDDFKNIKESLQATDLNRNSTSPEKCQLIMDHMEKINSSLSFIKHELKNWDLVDKSRVEELKNIFSTREGSGGNYMILFSRGAKTCAK